MQIEDLVKGWTEGWAGSSEAFAALFTEDAVYDDVPMGIVVEGRESIRAFHAQFGAIVANQAYRDVEYFADGRHVCVEWVLSATQVGDLPDLASQGKSFSVRGLTHFVVEEGLFSRCHDYWDRETAFSQLR